MRRRLADRAVRGDAAFAALLGDDDDAREQSSFRAATGAGTQARHTRMSMYLPLYYASLRAAFASMGARLLPELTRATNG